MRHLAYLAPADGGELGNMFHRRNSLNLTKRVRAFFWPERRFVRAWKYQAIRLSRIGTSRHSIAAGFASGVAVSLTPLLGLHLLLAFVLAFLTRGSLLAAALGTLVVNPLTFPLFFSVTYWIGARLRNVATADPGEALDRIVEGFDGASEAEADAAADAVLDAAEGMIDRGWSFAALELIQPVISTMLIGVLPLLPIAYVASYLAARMILRAFSRRRLR